MNAKRKVILPIYLFWSILLSVVALSPASAQTTVYSGNTSPMGTPRFNRPVEGGGSLSSTGSNVAYQTRTYIPTSTGNVRIVSNASGLWDNFVFVYTASFDPASPLTNFYAGNDDLTGIGTAGFSSLNLTAGTTYIIVTTGYSNTDTGAYTNSISPVQSNGDTTAGAMFARPDSSNTSLDPNLPIYPVDAISSAVNAVRYQAKTFSVTEAGLYRIQSEAVTSNYDPFTILYKGTFDPANPLTNIVIANDDFGAVEVSGFDIGLEANQTYTLVTTGVDNSQSGQYYYSYQKLYDFRAGFSGSTVGRTGIDISTLTDMFDPALTNPGNAVPFRAFRVAVAAGGFFRFQLFSKTFTANSYNPFLGVYSTPFNNSTPDAGIDLAAIDYPLLDTGDLDFASAGSMIFVVSGYKNTDAGDFRLEAFGEAAVTITPVAVVKGTVTLKTFIDNPPASPRNIPVKIVFRSAPGGVNTVVMATVSSSNGSYVANVPEGTFNVGFKAQTLQKVVTGVNTTSGVATGVNGLALFGADVNDDNYTDINDLLPLLSAYNRVSPSAGYNALADFNFDGTNDISDLTLLIAYYNQAGQFLP